MNDTHRAAARGGSGAVMGSKKLKAIVCRGTRKIAAFNEEAISAINKECVEDFSNLTMSPPPVSASTVPAVTTIPMPSSRIPGSRTGPQPVGYDGGAVIRSRREENGYRL